MMRAIALFVVVCAVAAQDNSTTPGNEPDPSPGPMGPEYIAGMIQMEQYMASKFLDIILKFQHAQHQHHGSMFFLQAQMVDWQASQNQDSEASELGLEEDDEEVSASSDNQAAKFRLMGAYYLLNSVHVKLYQILVKAPEVQMEYYYNRAMQMSMTSLGSQLPPQMYQLIYLSAFNTHLKTLKLSYALQYVSHFRTWLEDEIDVNGALVEDAQGADLIAQEQEDDLLMDRTFAFTSYFHLAQIDYQTFMLDMYTQYMWTAMMAPQGQQQQQFSFLETEETLGEQAEFMPFFGAGGNSIEMYSTWIRWYHIILQLTAAQSGQYSVQLEYFALHAEDQSTIDEDKISQASDFAFTSFASTLLQASQMQYWLAMLSMYSMYAPQQAQMAK